MTNDIHIRAQRSRLAAFGHHAEQFGDSAAGPAVAEARLTADEAIDLIRCLGLGIGPTCMGTEARELHDASGALVGLIFAPAKVIDASTFTARQIERALIGG